MKHFISGLVIGAVLFTPLAANAWNQRQMAQPIYGADCHHSRYKDSAPDKQAKYPEDWNCSVTIFVFDDAGNKCYLAKGSNGTGLSCVRDGE